MLGNIYEDAREADRECLRESTARPVSEAYGKGEPRARRKVDVTVYGPDGVYMEADDVVVEYTIDIVRTSWGINDIDINPRGKIEIFVSADPDKATGDFQKEFSVMLDFDKNEVARVDYMPGQVYVAHGLDIHLNEDFVIMKAVLNCFAISK